MITICASPVRAWGNQHPKIEEAYEQGFDLQAMASDFLTERLAEFDKYVGERMDAEAHLSDATGMR